MAKHLQRDASGHLMKRGEADDHLANGCAIPCDDCKANGPITATIVMDSGTCTCDATCGGGEVVSLAWQAGASDPTWAGSSGTVCVWDVLVVCVNDVWTLFVAEGLTLTAWIKVFSPEGCVMSGADGYPTHTGINTGIPTTVGSCGATCFLTVALS